MSDLPEGFTLEVGETTPEDIAEIFPQEREMVDMPEGFSPEPQAPESGIERFEIGVGRGLKERAQGAKQFGLDVVDLVTPTDKDIQAQKYYEEVNREKEDYRNTPVGKTTEAKAGEIVGNIIPDIPFGGMGKGSGYISNLSKTAGAGALAGATQLAESPNERVNNVVLATVFSGAGSLALDAARINANIINTVLRRSFSEPDILRTYNKSKRIAEESGIDMTFGQMTGSRSLLAYEDVAINAEKSADVTLSIMNKQARQAIANIRRTIDKLGDKTANPESVGIQIKDGLTKATDRVVKVRSYLWDKNMKLAKEASDGSPIAVPSKTVDQLDSIISELEDPLSSYPKSVITSFKKIREKASSAWTIDEYQKALKLWGKNAAGTGKPFKDLRTADQRRLFKDLMNSLGDDMDDIVAKGSAESKAINHLRNARNSWKINSGKIDEINNSVVGALLDKGGKPATSEAFYRSLIKMDASELKKVIPTLDKSDPRILNNARALIVKDALSKATADSTAPNSMVVMNAGDFIRNLKLDSGSMELFKGAPRKGMVKTIQAIKRISEKGSVSKAAQSPMGGQAEAAGLMGGAVAAHGLPDQVFIGRFLSKNLTPTRYAKLLMTKEGQKAVQNVANWNKVSRSVLHSSIGTLVGILNDPEI